MIINYYHKNLNKRLDMAWFLLFCLSILRDNLIWVCPEEFNFNQVITSRIVIKRELFEYFNQLAPGMYLTQFIRSIRLLHICCVILKEVMKPFPNQSRSYFWIIIFRSFFLGDWIKDFWYLDNVKRYLEQRQ